MRHPSRTLNNCVVALASVMFVSVLSDVLIQRMNSDSAEIPQTINVVALKHAARAYVALRRINADFKQQLAKTTDDTEKKQIAAKTRTQELEAVRQQGFNPEQYNLIITLVENDPGLREKFFWYVSAQEGDAG